MTLSINERLPRRHATGLLLLGLAGFVIVLLGLAGLFKCGVFAALAIQGNNARTAFGETFYLGAALYLVCYGLGIWALWKSRASR